MMTRLCRYWGWLRLVAAALAAMVCAAPSAHAQCNYEVTAIIQAPPCPFIGAPPTRGAGMNAHGHVCGSFEDCSGGGDWGFYWTPELGFKVMPKPQGVYSVQASGINDAGYIVGSSSLTGIGFRGFIFDPQTAQYTYMPTLHGVGNSYANAINNSNVVVGSRSIGTTGANPFNAVIWKPFEKGAPVQDLGVMNGPSSSARDGNIYSDGAGWSGSDIGVLNTRAVLWLKGKGIDLGVLPGMVQSQALGMNSVGDVVGSSAAGLLGPSQVFQWRNGTMSALLPPAGYDRITQTNINDLRQAAGRLRVSDSSIFHPYLWQHGEFYIVNKLVVVPPPEFQITSIPKVGNDGKLLCQATLNGKVVSAILTPVGVPPTDLNVDCRTNTYDLLILLEQWGPTPTNATGGVPIADFNGDGRVDVLDLLILLGNWG
ncbi:MAG TPA: dockerin type I domain-containing protein [Phycisphaerales bacterium]|nr:dockerin type I domain-containing protein [Phycisphaerales bacterium]